MSKKNLLTLTLLILLVLLSVSFLWHNTFYGDNVASFSHSLGFSYVATNLLFDGPLHINPELLNVPVTPSVAAWLYPPGLCTLINITYSIFGFQLTNVNIVLMILQILTVILAFFTFKAVMNRFLAFILSLFILAYSTQIATLADYLLQPFLILVFAIFLYYYHKSSAKPKPFTLITLGILVALISFIKQNTGITLFIVLSSYMLFSSLKFDTNNKDTSKISKILVPIVVIIYVIFGLVFLFMQRTIITSLYYLIPLGLFLLSFIYYRLFKNKNIYLNAKEFLRNFAFFVVPFLIVISAWFIWFGTTVGFSRYIHSLYGMYREYPGIFDVGIVSLLQRHFHFYGFDTLTSIGSTIYSLFYTCLIFIPFIAAFISAILISFHLIKNNLEKIRKYIGLSILGIMGIFILYPLESGHNIVTRIFIFLLILFFIWSKTTLFTKRNIIIVFTLLTIFLVPIFYTHINASLAVNKEDYTQISDTVNIKVPRELAAEINRATNLIDTTTENNKYYVIDSYAKLHIYYPLTNVHQMNYFMEMRPGILNKEITSEIVKTISDYQYLVVNKEQYDMFLNGISYNPDLDELFYYIEGNYEIKEVFIKNLKNDDSQLINFYIMGKKLAGIH